MQVSGSRWLSAGDPASGNLLNQSQSFKLSLFVKSRCHFALCPAGVIALAEEHARAEQLRLAPILAAKKAAAAAERKRWWESRWVFTHFFSDFTISFSFFGQPSNLDVSLLRKGKISHKLTFLQSKSLDVLFQRKKQKFLTNSPLFFSGGWKKRRRSAFLLPSTGTVFIELRQKMLSLSL